jgi:hypothetical protein
MFHLTDMYWVNPLSKISAKNLKNTQFASSPTINGTKQNPSKIDRQENSIILDADRQ